MNKLILMCLALLFVSCGGSSGDGGTTAPPADPTPAPVVATTLTLSANTVEQNDSPTLTLTADKAFFTDETTVTLASFACSTLTINSTTTADCLVDNNSTTTIQFEKVTATTGSTTLMQNYQVTATTPLTTDYVGIRENGDFLSFNTLDDSIDKYLRFDGYESGTTDLVLGVDRYSLYLGSNYRKCLSEWYSSSQEYLLNYVISTRDDEFTPVDNYGGMVVRITLTSETTVKVEKLDWDWSVVSTENLSMFCNAEEVTYLYEDNNDPRITPKYTAIGMRQLGDPINDKVYAGGSRYMTATLSEALDTTGEWTPEVFYEGKVYDDDNSVTTSGGLVKIVSGSVCDTNDDIIAGTSEYIFFKSTESTAVANQFYRLSKKSGDLYQLTGYYNTSANGACVAKVVGLLDRPVGYIHVVGSSIHVSLTDQPAVGDELHIDRIYSMKMVP